MSKIEYLVCDVCKGEDGVTHKTLTVIFTTEQNEGRSIKPHLSNKAMDICKNCVSHMIESQQLLTGSGAMGYNDYFIKYAFKEQPHE